MLYALYRFGYCLANRLSIRNAYRLATLIADIHFTVSRNDRNAVIKNIRVILGQSSDEKKIRTVARQVFRNFAKYLVDFFRFARIDEAYLKRFVKVEGLEHVDKGLSAGKGVIALSAHLGNWELGGFVLSLLRSPLKAVVLTHRHKKINDFFTRQRLLSNMKPIELGISLRACYKTLKNNGLLALLGDRDFSKNGIEVQFFGKKTKIPKGPAVFSQRTGSCLVPCFMIRQDDDTFKLVFEPPIYFDPQGGEEHGIKLLTQKYASIIESYVRRYPGQWYTFKEVWPND